MEKTDLARFAVIMLGMADNFRDSITKAGIKMRFEMLKAFSIDQVEEAAKKIMMVRKYTKMPPVAEFIETIQGTIDDNAEIQSCFVISCIGQNHPGFTDPITEYLMSKRWPWHEWAPAVLKSELKWWAEDFKKAYRSFGKSEQKRILIDCPDCLNLLIKKIGTDVSEIFKPRLVERN